MKFIGNQLNSFWGQITRRKPMDEDVLDTPLCRCLNTCDLILLGIGHMAGSGIYVVTGTVMLDISGPSTMLSYLFAGIVALLFGLCYAQFSVNIPKTGTCYVYVYLVGGELLAFLAGWNLILDYTVSVASVGRALSAYLDQVTNGTITKTTRVMFTDSFIGIERFHIDLVGPAFIIIAFILISLGARITAHVNNVLVVINIIVISSIIVLGCVYGNIENVTKGPGGFFPYGFSGTVSGMGVVFFAYLGFDAVATASEETKDTNKSLPIAFCVALTVTMLLYVFASFALSLLIPYNEVVPVAPFPSAFARHGVIWSKYYVTVGAVTGLTCSMIGQAYSMPRGIYALATDGLLFKLLIYVNPWTKTPLLSILISALLSAFLAMLFAIHELVEMVSIGILFAMVLMIICLLKIHYMSAKDCPFKLVEEENQNTLPDGSESKPILKSQGAITLEKIGKLRFDVPILKDCNENTVTSAAIIVLTLSLSTLSGTLVLLGTSILNHHVWSIIWLCLVLIIATASLCTLLLYNHNSSFLKFKVPLFPWIPVIALFSGLYMMASLEGITWLRLAIWIAVGLVFYFSYGIRNSVMAQKHGYKDLDAIFMKDEPAGKEGATEKLEPNETEPINT